jgi:hypothetical protein
MFVQSGIREVELGNRLEPKICQRFLGLTNPIEAPIRSAASLSHDDRVDFDPRRGELRQCGAAPELKIVGMSTKC